MRWYLDFIVTVIYRYCYRGRPEVDGLRYCCCYYWPAVWLADFAISPRKLVPVNWQWWLIYFIMPNIYLSCFLGVLCRQVPVRQSSGCSYLSPHNLVCGHFVLPAVGSLIIFERFMFFLRDVAFDRLG